MEDEDTTQTGDEGFDDAFSEFAGGPGGDKGGGEDAAAAGDTEGGSDDDQGKAGDGALDDDAGRQAGGEDPYAGLPEDVVARLKKVEEERDQLQHRIKSDEGRVRAFQQQAAEAQRKLEEAMSGGGAPSDRQIHDAMQTPESWGKFKEEFPEVSVAIEGYWDAREAKLRGDMEARLKPFEDARVEEATVKSETELAAAYPNWQDIVATDEFAQWLADQPTATQGLADSDAAKDAASLLGYYDNHLVASGKTSIRSADGKTPVASGGSSEADQLAARRRQQLEDGDTLRGRRAGIQPGDAEGDGFESDFAFFANRRKA